MFGKFLPKEHNFFDLFRQHARATTSGALELLSLCRNRTDIEARVAVIKQHELKGDEITHQTVDLLHQTFITPFDRDDIHKLISGMDDILDGVNSIARRVLMYEVGGVLSPAARHLAETLWMATSYLEGAVEKLHDMKQAKSILEACKNVYALERDGDATYAQGMALLFRETDDAIFIIKCKEIYDFLEEAIDQTKAVANLIEGIIMEHA